MYNLVMYYVRIVYVLCTYCVRICTYDVRMIRICTYCVRIMYVLCMYDVRILYVFCTYCVKKNPNIMLFCKLSASESITGPSGQKSSKYPLYS